MPVEHRQCDKQRENGLLYNWLSSIRDSALTPVSLFPYGLQDAPHRDLHKPAKLLVSYTSPLTDAPQSKQDPARSRRMRFLQPNNVPPPTHVRNGQGLHQAEHRVRDSWWISLSRQRYVQETRSPQCTPQVSPFPPFITLRSLWRDKIPAARPIVASIDNFPGCRIWNGCAECQDDVFVVGF